MIDFAAALSINAEVSGGLAGFVGIITVFGKRAEERLWSVAERVMLRTMLLLALTNVGAALLPLALGFATQDQLLTWRVANGFFGAAHLALWASNLPIVWTKQHHGIPKVVGVPTVFLGVATHLVCLSVAIGFLARHAQFVLLWGLWWGLYVGALMFVALLFTVARSEAA